MTVDYGNLNQVVNPIAASIPDVILLLEQVNTCHSTRYTPIDLADFFFSYLFITSIRSSLLSDSKGSNTPSIFYFRDISSIQPYVII